ncbi:hypothetical protein ABZ299_26905 [Streptomyces sp. NPDC006184]|uniref:hypothetical protein n=1 Tax=Streptomyces sp. NPDC006184 TaxID=3155455 RepID=UPI0033ACE82F
MVASRSAAPSSAGRDAHGTAEAPGTEHHRFGLAGRRREYLAGAAGALLGDGLHRGVPQPQALGRLSRERSVHRWCVCAPSNGAFTRGATGSHTCASRRGSPRHHKVGIITRTVTVGLDGSPESRTAAGPCAGPTGPMGRPPRDRL